MCEIFISYRRDDSRDSAERLADRLIAHFHSNGVFIDVDNIRFGADFVETIAERLGTCALLIAVIGKHWLTSSDEQGRRRLDDPTDYVRTEIATALKRGVLVIPILVDGASIPQEHDLPDDLKPLVRKNAAEVSPNRFRADSERLIAAIKPVMDAALAAWQREQLIEQDAMQAKTLYAQVEAARRAASLKMIEKLGEERVQMTPTSVENMIKRAEEAQDAAENFIKYFRKSQ